MKLGSHNTMTYLKPRKWYLYPFRFLARCQSKNIVDQYMSGVRWFDLRIAFNKHCNPYFRHGLMSYKGDVFKTLDYLDFKKDTIVRILLEKDSPLYYDFCKHIEEKYSNIKFYGGKRKSDWKQIYKFKDIPEFSIEECYSSAPNSKYKWLSPKLYAWLHRKTVTNANFLVVDFVELWKNQRH